MNRTIDNLEKILNEEWEQAHTEVRECLRLSIKAAYDNLARFEYFRLDSPRLAIESAKDYLANINASSTREFFKTLCSHISKKDKFIKSVFPSLYPLEQQQKILLKKAISLFESYPCAFMRKSLPTIMGVKEDTSFDSRREKEYPAFRHGHGLWQPQELLLRINKTLLGATFITASIKGRLCIGGNIGVSESSQHWGYDLDKPDYQKNTQLLRKITKDINLVEVLDYIPLIQWSGSKGVRIEKPSKEYYHGYQWLVFTDPTKNGECLLINEKEAMNCSNYSQLKKTMICLRERAMGIPLSTLRFGYNFIQAFDNTFYYRRDQQNQGDIVAIQDHLSPLLLKISHNQRIPTVDHNDRLPLPDFSL